ncbi:MAG: fumarylacetoacetate hydrolase family protein [Solirubrobacteraceae bacterium]
MRTRVDGATRVVAEWAGSTAVATVGDREFDDLPELLEACGGSPHAIRPGREAPLDHTRLLRPVGKPRKVVCIGLNYRLHAEESETPLPERPMLFPKWTTSLTGPHDDVSLPPESAFVDWEAELAFVFGARCRRVPAVKAEEVVFGYAAANDVSMRDFQSHTSQFGAGKAWDRATPLGPAVVPIAELGGIRPDLAIQGRLNGETVQRSRTDDLIFGIPELVEYLTTIMTMEPGDLVLTGTPSGVGVAADPPRSLSDGDLFEVEIEGIGRLANRFVAESA